jgi:hypothetical protein
MSALCFHTVPLFDCFDDDLSDAAFVWASKYIGGRDAVEEFVACSVWLLGAGVNFDQVSVGVTLVLKLKVPLPNFVASHKDDEDGIKFLARVVSEAKVVVGSYTRLEHDACIAGLHNKGQLNRVLEHAGVPYGPRLVPGSDASTETSKKRKTEYVGKVVAKRPKAPEKRKAYTTKTFALRGKTGLKWPSDVEVASLKSLKLSKKIVPRAVATAAAARCTLGASGPKSTASALISKIIGCTSASKPTACVKKSSTTVKTSCPRGWGYGGAVFERISGVFAAWSEDRGLNAPNCPKARTSWAISACVVAQFAATS